MRIAYILILCAGFMAAKAALASPQILPPMADLAARLLPSVVSVASTDPMVDSSGDDSDGGASLNPNQPPGGMRPSQSSDVSGAASTTVIPPPKAEEALGSGFIFDPSGYIATNNHVIDGATSVTVTLNDGTILPAKVVGQDKRGDLAVLKVDAGHKLPAVQFGDSSKLRVGDWVLAVGNPYGLDESSSAGIVSALHRDIGEDKYDDFIQTDATINRGNSGGPLFDLSGHVIGINSAIYSPSGGSVGIGFAIPSAMVQPVVESLKTTGMIKRGWLGVSSQEVTPEIQKLLELPSTSGALIGGTMENGPAENKLRPGDVLVSLGGVAITNPRSLMIRTAQILSGQTANATFWRDGTLQHAAITIEVPPRDKPPGTAPTPAAQASINLTSIGLAISPAASANGLTVTAVTNGGPAAKAGLVADNTIAAIGAINVTSPATLRDELNDLASNHQKVAVLLVSGDTASGDDPGPRWVPVRLAK
jgi:serine protease Do/2-alkenal reductase